MLRSAILCIAFTCMVISCAEVKKTHQLKPLPSAIPALHITNDTTATALKISMLNIKTDIAANIATTTFDIRFYNPNDKVLEGEFEFPLADGQQISRYALDMNGSMREGVVVEKAKARVAFENTLRRKIDPGLVEKTKGNNFRTRIYPLPAKGYRRILIAVEQTLELQDKDFLYQLPLYAEKPIDSFSLKITVIKSTDKPQLDANGVPLKFERQQENYVAGFSENNFIANKTVAFVLPGTSNSNLVLTENHEGQTYFYVNSRIAPKYSDKRKPLTIGLLWDISSSGEKRDQKKEIALLKQYLSGLGNVAVSLIPFNIYVQNKEDFRSTDKLIDRIRTLDYDGGTQLGAIDLSKYSFDEMLMFSDGLSTFGREDMHFGNSPVITVTTSPSANYSYLKYIALQTHGKFIDLGKFDSSVALKEMQGESLQIINVEYDRSQIADLVLPTTPILNSGLSFAGKLNAESADIKIELGFGNKVIDTKEFTVSRSRQSDYDQIKRIWAGMKVQELDMEFDKNKDEITKIGKEFSVVTQNTSLLVLDRVEDYVQYEIVPPTELQKEYFTLIQQKHSQEANDKSMAMDQALDEMNTLKDWWKTDFSLRSKRSVPNSLQLTLPTIGGDSLRVADSIEITAGVGAFSEVQLDSVHFNYSVPRGDDKPAPMSGNALYSLSPSRELLEERAVTVDNFDTGSGYVGDLKKHGDEEPAATIVVNEWKSDATYLKTLEQTSAKERFEKYLSLKKEFNDQPSFFVDVARFFIEKNEKETGVLVLSNVSEMKLEDAELLRIVANQLMDANEKGLAIETFKQILRMREEDPQSYRDLALAYGETGEYDKAVEYLYKLVTGTWDSRFGDVKGIALNEMNAIISAHNSVNTVAIDKRLIFPMPVDVRIVIGWSSDNSDIDLWVTDPNKEKCFYEHTETVIGGRISQDVTQGYGPEEFLLKKAKNGDYLVDVNLYGDSRQTLGGPISIKADLFTDFGRPTQKKRTINFRVTTNKEVVNLGSLKFGS